MPDYFRYGLPLAVLIAFGVTCLLVAFTPTTPNSTSVPARMNITETTTVPYTAPDEVITSDA